jgi:prepilin-type N-terminal cleavage/methylation domain-containing protein
MSAHRRLDLKRGAVHAGFTLVEVLIVIGILLILFNLLLIPLMTGMSLTGATQAEVEAQDRVNRALAELQRDLSQAMYVYPQLGGQAADLLKASYPVELLEALGPSHVDLVLPKRDGNGNVIQPLVPDDFITRYYVAPIWDQPAPTPPPGLEEYLLGRYRNPYRRSVNGRPIDWNVCVLYRVRFNPFYPRLDTAEGFPYQGSSEVTNPLFEGETVASGFVGMDQNWRGLGPASGQPLGHGPQVDGNGDPINVSLHWQLPWFYDDWDTSPVPATGEKGPQSVPYAYWWRRLSEPLTPTYKADMAVYAYKGGAGESRFGLDNKERGKSLPLGLFDGRDLVARPDTATDAAYQPPVAGFRIEPALVEGDNLTPSEDYSEYRARYAVWDTSPWATPRVRIYGATGVEKHPAPEPRVDPRRGVVSFTVEALAMYVQDYDPNTGEVTTWDWEEDRPPTPAPNPPPTRRIDPTGWYDDLIYSESDNSFQLRAGYHQHDGLTPPAPPFGPAPDNEYPHFVVVQESETLWATRIYLDDTGAEQGEPEIRLYARVQGNPGKHEYTFDPRTGIIRFGADGPFGGMPGAGELAAGWQVRVEVSVRYAWRNNFTPFNDDWTQARIVNDTVVADYSTWVTANVSLALVAFGPAAERPGEIRRSLRVAVSNARL